LKMELHLGARGGRGYVIDPRTGAVYACQWSVDYERELTPRDPFGPPPFFHQEGVKMKIVLEMPDDAFVSPPARAPSPALSESAPALLEETSG